MKSSPLLFLFNLADYHQYHIYINITFSVGKVMKSPSLLFLFNLADYLSHQYYTFYIFHIISSTYIHGVVISVQLGRLSVSSTLYFLYCPYYISYVIHIISVHGKCYEISPFFYFCSTLQIISIINIIFSILCKVYHLRISVSYIYMEKVINEIPLFIISVQLGRLSLSSILYFLYFPYCIIYVYPYHIYTWRK